MSGPMRRTESGTREQTHGYQTGVRQARMNALADGPDTCFAAGVASRLTTCFDHNVIELADHPLVGAEHHYLDGAAVRSICRRCIAAAAISPSRKHAASPNSTAR